LKQNQNFKAISANYYRSLLTYYLSLLSLTAVFKTFTMNVGHALGAK